MIASILLRHPVVLQTDYTFSLIYSFQQLSAFAIMIISICFIHEETEDRAD